MGQKYTPQKKNASWILTIEVSGYDEVIILEEAPPL